MGQNRGARRPVRAWLLPDSIPRARIRRNRRRERGGDEAPDGPPTERQQRLVLLSHKGTLENKRINTPVRESRSARPTPSPSCPRLSRASTSSCEEPPKFI